MSKYRVFPEVLVADHQAIALEPDKVLRTADPDANVMNGLFGQHGSWKYGLSVNL